ncbi:hypothetical protein D3C83_280380 [compost metagenome]
MPTPTETRPIAPITQPAIHWASLRPEPPSTGSSLTALASITVSSGIFSVIVLGPGGTSIALVQVA